MQVICRTCLHLLHTGAQYLGSVDPSNPSEAGAGACYSWQSFDQSPSKVWIFRGGRCVFPIPGRILDEFHGPRPDLQGCKHKIAQHEAGAVRWHGQSLLANHGPTRPENSEHTRALAPYYRLSMCAALGIPLTWILYRVQPLRGTNRCWPCQIHPS
jgi:hypothetical protein